MRSAFRGRIGREPDTPMSARCRGTRRRDRTDALAHAAGVEPASEVVDLVHGGACHGVIEREDVLPAVGASAGDLDVQRAGYQAAYVEEGQAAFVLLVGFGGLADDLEVEHDEGLGAGVGRDDDGGGASYADLRGGHAHAPAEDVLLAGPLQRAEQLGDHGIRLVFLVGEPEGDGLLVQDRVTVLDDAGCLHPVCRGAQCRMLLAVVGPVAEAPLEPVPCADWWVAGCPGEYGLVAAFGVAGLVRSGIASAVAEVSVLQTTGSSVRGKSGQRPCTVEGVGSFRLARVALHADPHQVAGDRLRSGVAQDAPLGRKSPRRYVHEVMPAVVWLVFAAAANRSSSLSSSSPRFHRVMIVSPLAAGITACQ